MRGRVFFWLVLVPFGVFALPSYWPLIVTLGAVTLVMFVVAAFRQPQGPSDLGAQRYGVCGVWTSRMKGPSRLRAGHFGSHASR